MYVSFTCLRKLISLLIKVDYLRVFSILKLLHTFLAQKW